MPLKLNKYGWRPDKPDYRDYLYTASPLSLKKLPQSVDLRAKMPKVYDQGQLGSCTAQAIAASIQYDMIREKKRDYIPSRLFIYYNERVLENSINSDSGAEIRDGIKTVHGVGYCSEKILPYTIAKFKTQPSQKCYSDASKHKIMNYERLSRDIEVFKSCLSEGNAIIFGFSVYESFESKETSTTGIVSMPTKYEDQLGGHAVVMVGYTEDNKFICRNSWGENWGDKGYFYMPAQYLMTRGLSADFWTIKAS
jgi:C1A family cysteine protease